MAKLVGGTIIGLLALVGASVIGKELLRWKEAADKAASEQQAEPKA